MINLERVATFLAVATCGGFREAAKRTGLSQPAVTQHVRRLEQSLKVSLIERNNAGSTLTPEGRAFLPYAENLMRICDRASALFEKTSVSIGASSNTGIYLLQPYLKAYKEISSHKLNVVIGDNPSIAAKLQSFEIDVAIMEWWDDRPGFKASLWRAEDLVLIVPPRHPWADMPSIPSAWLKGQDLLGGEPGTGTGRLLQQYMGDKGDDVRTIGISMQLGSTEAVKHAVRAGLGISLVMAAAVEQESRNGQLRVIPIEEKPLRKEIYVIRRDNAAADAPASQFTDFLLLHDHGIPMACI